MCIHSRQDEIDHQEALNRVIEKRSTPKERKAELKRLAPVRYLYNSGRYGQGEFVDASDEQDVANMARDLAAWHGFKGKYLDFSAVNAKRAELKLAPLDSSKLPSPVGEVAPSQDAIAA